MWAPPALPPPEVGARISPWFPPCADGALPVTPKAPTTRVGMLSSVWRRAPWVGAAAAPTINYGLMSPVSMKRVWNDSASCKRCGVLLFFVAASARS